MHGSYNEYVIVRGVILTLALRPFAKGYGRRRKLQRRRAAYFQMKEWWFSALVRVHRLRASLWRPKGPAEGGISQALHLFSSHPAST